MISVEVSVLFVVENLLVITIPNTHVYTALFFNYYEYNYIRNGEEPSH